MDTVIDTTWMTASWRDDLSTPQSDSHWWGMTQTLDAGSGLFSLPPPVDPLESFYGLSDSLSRALPSETAMAADSPSMFDYVDDDFVMASPPTTPSTSTAYPSPLASPASDSGVSVDNIKTKPKARRSLTSKPRSSGSRGKSRLSRKQPAHEDSSDPKLQRTRTCHNVVEKNYRNRLNGQFELMLKTLNETRARAGDGFGEMEGVDKNFDRVPGKSAVLQLARERLISLERENESLRLEVERLKASSHTEFSYSRTALV